MRRAETRVARASGILGLVALTLILLGGPTAYGLTLVTRSDIVLLALGSATLTLTFTGSILAITLAFCSRMVSHWATVGLVCGVVSFLACFGVPALILLCGF
jgi:hypothetical protein